MKRLIPSIAFTFALLLLPGLAWAQQGTITGTVTEAETGDALPGATVQVPDEGTGAATGSDGQYRITGVPAGEQTVRVTFVGYQAAERTVNVPEGGTVRANFQLQTTEAELEEVVVTGVSVGTDTRKLGFTVDKIGEGDLQEVPSTNPADALRAKTPGARIVQASGQPGTAPSIRLRGTTTLSGSQEPLLVVDGAITSGGLQDIDTQSIQSIEIIKGAAAASQYGSLAANGVIQVITDRGQSEEPQTRVTVRNELGITQLPSGQIDLAETHNKDASKADDSVEEGAFRVSCDQPPCDIGPESDRNIFENDFSELNDQQGEIYDPNLFYTNYVSFSSQQQGLNYLLSFENQTDQGVVEGFDPYDRRNFRVNIDNEIQDGLEISGSFLYSNSEGTDFLENGQFGNSPFYSALLAFPDLNLRQPAPDSIDAEFNPFNASGNAANPLYRAEVVDRNFEDRRLFGNVKADWELTDWLTVDAQFSWDDDRSNFRTTTERGSYSTDPAEPPNEGGLFENEFRERLYTTRARAIFSQDFADLSTQFTARYQYEDRTTDFFSLNGSSFLTSRVEQFDNTNFDELNPTETETTLRSEDVVGSLVLDYQDTYIIDAVLRRERVSLFGPDERNKVYYRVAGTYRTMQDFDLPGIQQLKLRGVYGTSGSRPPFGAQYETFNVTSTGVTKEQLGNRQIRPANVSEVEVGLDARFLDRFYLEGTYSRQNAEDQVLNVPLSATAGFSDQFQNAGTVETSTWEFSAGGDIVRGEDFNFNLGIVFDRTRQEVTNLQRPGFLDNVGAQIPLFRIQEGENIGAMYGNEFATSVDDLFFTDNGCLINESPTLGSDGCLEREDLTVNGDGYVIEEGTEFSAGDEEGKETPFLIRDETGQPVTKKIGDSNPDFNMGFNADLQYNNWTLYATVDWEQGADVYNYTKQLLYFNERHGDLDQSDRPEDRRREADYYVDALYNRASASSHFVEDGSFVKLRELSISYRFTPEFFESIGVGDQVFDAKFSLLGRNLLTFTDYDGYDPEVSTDTADQPVNYKIDDFAYPNFRSYTASFEIRF